MASSFGAPGGGLPAAARCVSRATHARTSVGERRENAFVSLDDFKRRVQINKDELRTLAEIGALNCFAGHRRDALWEVERQAR